MKTIRKYVLGWTLCLLAVSFAADAADMSAARANLESNLTVTGWVDIKADGSVQGYVLDHPEALPDVVVKMVGDNVPKWTFAAEKPGAPAVDRFRMGLVFVAQKLDKDRFKISLRAASFDKMSGMGEHIAPNRMSPPTYPANAVAMGAQGVVFLVLKVNSSGQVDDVAVEQVNLRVLGTPAQMKKASDALSQAAARAARKWSFYLPTVGDAASDGFHSVRVPVDFGFADKRKAAYGDWDTYVRGPKNVIPWRTEDVDAKDSPDAYLAGNLYLEGNGRRLLTPLNQG